MKQVHPSQEDKRTCFRIHLWLFIGSFFFVYCCQNFAWINRVIQCEESMAHHWWRRLQSLQRGGIYPVPPHTHNTHFSLLCSPVHAVAGDVLVLTKPLGTNVVTNVHQWLEHADRWSRVANITTEEEGTVNDQKLKTRSQICFIVVSVVSQNLQ